MLTLTGHTGQVHSVAFLPDGTLLASQADDGAVQLWSVSAGTLRSSLQLGGRSSRGGAGMAFAPGRLDFIGNFVRNIKLLKSLPRRIHPADASLSGLRGPWFSDPMPQ